MELTPVDVIMAAQKIIATLSANSETFIKRMRGLVIPQTRPCIRTSPFHSANRGADLCCTINHKWYGGLTD